VEFPPALARFLVRIGYLAAEQAFWLGKVKADR
jgi:hypothetical protein